MSEHSPERRKHKRLSRRFICRFRPFEGEKGKGAWQVSTTKNISMSGCYITTSEPAEKGTVLELEVQMPQLQGGFIRMIGEVTRNEVLQNVPGLTVFGLGIDFMKFDEAKKEQMRKLLEELIERKARKHVA